jgi:acetylglutamate kinase
LKLLVKLGGSLLDAAASRAELARQIAALPAASLQAVVVHGGGKQMTRFLAEHGVESRFVNGLRVTTPEIVDALLKVFAGSVNKELVASLVAAGARAVGLSGIDGALAEAERLRPDLGAVGRITRMNTALLDVLVHGGYLPVVACVAGNLEGAVFNVNADQMATATAAAWRADRLIFLTDVDGVRGPSGEILKVLTVSEAGGLMRDAVVSGGMQAKLEACNAALAAGVAEVVIAPGAAADILPRLLAGEPVGTRVIPEAVC